MTGTLAELTTASMRPGPPRGTMMSTMPRRDPSAGTASRSVKGSSVTASAGRPAARRPVANDFDSAMFVWIASLPPRSTQPLPDFRQRAAASTVTFGRDSKMMATRPMGTRRRIIRRPLGRVQSSVTSPTGSGSFATASQATAISSRRAWSRRRRSVIASVTPLALAVARSLAFASRMAASSARRAWAAARKAASRTAVGARARAREAFLAVRAISVTRWRRSLISSSARSGCRASCPRRVRAGRLRGDRWR